MVKTKSFVKFSYSYFFYSMYWHNSYHSVPSLLPYTNWEDLGLPSQPSLMNNVVHFSASPLEGLREKLNWIQRKFLEDPYGRALAEQGITRTLLKESFFLDPMVTVPGRDTGKVNIFEVLKDLDAKECLDMMIRVYDQELNEALREKGCSGCSCIIS